MSSHYPAIVVSRSGNVLLYYKDFPADGAVLAFSLAALDAGGGDCCICDHGMSRSGNVLLCHDDFTADRAVLALGLAVLGAGGGLTAASTTSV